MPNSKDKFFDVIDTVKKRQRNSGSGGQRAPLLMAEEKIEALTVIKDHVNKALEMKKDRLDRYQEKLAQRLESKSDSELGSGLFTMASPATDVMESICEEIGMTIEDSNPWISTTWFTIFRLRQAFFLMCAFSILLSLFTGWLMEIFFSIMGGAHLSFEGTVGFFRWLKWHAIFWNLPFIMMTLAVLGDEMCDLILDSLDFPALHMFQATLVAALVRKKRTFEGHLPVRLSDSITLIIFEAVPVVVAGVSVVYFGFNAGQGFLGLCTLCLEGYIQGSLLSAVLCTVVFVISDMVVAANKGVRYKEKRDWIAFKIDQKKMNPYCLSRPFSMVDISEWADDGEAANAAATSPFAPAEALQSEVTDKPDAGASPPATEGCTPSASRWLAVVVVVLWTVVVGCFFHFNSTNSTMQSDASWFDPIFLGLTLVLTVWVCSFALHKTFPGIYGAPYVMILIFFVMVGVSLNISSAVRPESHETTMEPIMSILPGQGVSSKMWQPPSRGSHGVPQPYPVCNMVWGSKDSPLRALDLANLAWVIYDPTPDQTQAKAHIQKMLDGSFPTERHAQLVDVKDYMDLPRWGHIHFPPTGNGTRGTRVVAVKGTSTVMDALVDTNLFSTVKVLQSFQLVLPVMTVLPRLVIQWILHRVHLSTAREAEKRIWDSLEKDVGDLMKKYPNDAFVITGHSLGGGLSQIVAAKLNVPALVWSAPGAEYSAKRFGIQVQSLKRNVVSVMPDHDVVPRVDLQGGMVQLIECRKKDGSEASALNCHSLVKTACEVWRTCGDDRDFRKTCEPFVSRKDLGGLFDADDSTA